MREVIHNVDHLPLEEPDEVVNRVKILLINSKNEVLLGYAYGTYQFVGGHVEKNESFNDCIKREVKEEAGIELKTEDLVPFMVIKYLKNKDNVISRSEIYYFVIYTDDPINYQHTKYTLEERKGNFELRYINLNKIEDVLIENIGNNAENEIIVPEMLSAIEEYKNHLVRS